MHDEINHLPRVPTDSILHVPTNFNKYQAFLVGLILGLLLLWYKATLKEAPVPGANLGKSPASSCPYTLGYSCTLVNHPDPLAIGRLESPSTTSGAPSWNNGCRLQLQAPMLGRTGLCQRLFSAQAKVVGWLPAL